MLREPVPIKKICLWCLIVTLGMLVVCMVFISIVSIWAGFFYMHQPGFWVPILGGGLLLFLVLFLYQRATKRIFFHMKEEDVLMT